VCHLSGVKNVMEGQSQLIVAKVTLRQPVGTPEGFFSHLGGRARGTKSPVYRRFVVPRQFSQVVGKWPENQI